MRRRATSGEMARGALIFCFGDSFTRPGVDGTPPCGGAGEGGVFVFSLEVAPVLEGDSFTRPWLGNASVPPQEGGGLTHRPPHFGGNIQHAAGESPFIVIPRQNFGKLPFSAA